MPLKLLTLKVAQSLGLFALSRRVTRNWIRVLAYHGIWLGEDHFGNFLFMGADTFKQRMQFLRKQQYPVISLESAVNSYRDMTPALPCSTVITIDDGWVGTHRHMLPALQEAGFPATLYASTYYAETQQPVTNVMLQYVLHCWQKEQPKRRVSLLNHGLENLSVDSEASFDATAEKLRSAMEQLGSDREKQALNLSLCEQLEINSDRWIHERWFHLMNEDELREISQSGVSLELHTHRHTVPVGGPSTLTDELSENKSRLQRLAGDEPKHFCYPSGIYDERWFGELATFGVESATTTEVGMLRPRTSKFLIPRILDGENVSELEFAAEMSGFMELLRQLRRAVARK